MNKNALMILCTASLWAAGCAQSSRYVTAEHWHDDSTFFVAYTEYNETSYVVSKSGSSTAHVMMCRVEDDNSTTCRPQADIDRLLNPDEDIEDPPPAEDDGDEEDDEDEVEDEDEDEDEDEES